MLNYQRVENGGLQLGKSANRPNERGAQSAPSAAEPHGSLGGCLIVQDGAPENV